jgi:glycosyltransferase involved in cell wall biosynthesis
MRIALLIPGTCEAFYCENCLRDLELFEALQRLGHEAVLVPLYLPLTADAARRPGEAPLFFGGLNVYLGERTVLGRREPAWLRRMLNWRRLLRWAARASSLTSPRDLGESTLSMLQGRHAYLVRELERLVRWLADEGRPDAVVLSTVLLAGLGRGIRERLGVPVAALLQDEDAFLDALPEEFGPPAWRAVAEGAGGLDLLIAVSSYFRDVMVRRLGLAPGRVRAVRMGLDPSGYGPAAGPPGPPVVGFLSPAVRNKGLDLVWEAVRGLREEPPLAGLRLRASGGQAVGSREFLRDLKRRIRRAGLGEAVEFLPNFGRPRRQEFLRSLTVLAVPLRQPEAFGMWALEALASGVPAVGPRHGGLVEIAEATGGVRLVEPGDPDALRQALRDLLLGPDEARRIGLAGRRAVLERFTADRAAREVVAALEDLAAGRS